MKKQSDNLDIEKHVIEGAAKDLADDIDFEIVSGVLCDSGWSKVILSPMTWEQGMDIDLWCEQHVKKKFRNRGLVWIFEDDKDATWFRLKWLA